MDLRSEFAGWRDNDSGDMVFLGGFVKAEEFLDEGEEKGEGFAAASYGLLP